MIYHGGAENATIGTVIVTASRTNAKVDDVRNLVGDTEDTIKQIYTYDKVGEKLCGWFATKK